MIAETITQLETYLKTYNHIKYREFLREKRKLSIANIISPENEFYLLNIFPIPDTNNTEQVIIEPITVTSDEVMETKIKIFTDSIATYIDSKAKAYGFDSIYTAAVRGSYPDSPFYLIGTSLGKWMDQVWSYSLTELDKIKNGSRVEPTIEDFILELPELIILTEA